jgi:hypothetical protein
MDNQTSYFSNYSKNKLTGIVCQDGNSPGLITQKYCGIGVSTYFQPMTSSRISFSINQETKLLPRQSKFASSVHEILQFQEQC